MKLSDTQAIGLHFLEETVTVAVKRRDDFLVQCLRELGQDPNDGNWRFDIKTKSFSKDEPAPPAG